jgi:hypothetical protein
VSIVNKGQLAEIIGKAENTLTTWQYEGLPIRSKGGRGSTNQYDTAEVIEWMIQRALAGERSESGRERRDRLEADRLELMIAKETGQLVAASEIEPLWANAILAARNEFLLGTEKLKTIMDSHYGIDCDIDLLNGHIREILARLAEHTPGGDKPDGQAVAAVGAPAEPLDH